MNINTPTLPIIEQIKKESNRFYGLRIEVAKVIIGQEHIVDAILNAILCNGHILLEGVPGVAKTTMIKAVTKAMGLHFNRIQFTPDMLPTDIIGTQIYNPKNQEFEPKKGPVFANLILADEINRAPAKVQAALLEAMQERQVTIGSHTYQLEEPFLVFATQNPIEQEGTYRLPEAQLDRFLFKITVGYPTIAQEQKIISHISDIASVQQVVTKEDIAATQLIVDSIYVDEKIVDYITHIVFATRTPDQYGLVAIAPYLSYGVSPRATIALYKAAKANAFLAQRHFVTPDDVKAIARSVLRHRLVLSYEAEADNVDSDSIVNTILGAIAAP